MKVSFQEQADPRPAAAAGGRVAAVTPRVAAVALALAGAPAAGGVDEAWDFRVSCRGGAACSFMRGAGRGLAIRRSGQRGRSGQLERPLSQVPSAST